MRKWSDSSPSRTTTKLYGNRAYDWGNCRYLIYGRFEVNVTIRLHWPQNSKQLFWELPDNGLNYRLKSSETLSRRIFRPWSWYYFHKVMLKNKCCNINMEVYDNLVIIPRSPQFISKNTIHKLAIKMIRNSSESYFPMLELVHISLNRCKNKCFVLKWKSWTNSGYCCLLTAILLCEYHR